MVSELRKSKLHGDLLAWMQVHKSAQMYLAAETVGEIQAGMQITRAQDAAKVQEIEAWLEAWTASFAALPMDPLAFREWARLMHRKSKGLSGDAMIAGFATTRGLTVVTKNTANFKDFGVASANPFTG